MAELGSTCSDDSACPFLRQRSFSCGSATNPPRKSYKVSNWDKKLVGKYFQIYYDNDMIAPKQLLEKITTIDSLNKEQREHAEKLKHHLRHINAENATLRQMQFYPEKFKQVVDDIYDGLKPEMEPNVSLRKDIVRFVESLRDISNELKRKRDLDIYEKNFTKLLTAFAEMCCLRACCTMGKEDGVVWENLLGLKKVTSVPDIRLKKFGVSCLREEFDSPLVVSVVEVKRDSSVSGIDSLSDKFESTSIDHAESDSCESGSESDSCESGSESDSCESGSNYKPSIETFLNTRVLGQHAGELLLDLYDLKKNCTEISSLTMPGMIVDKTEIFFTLLVMSHEHFNKLIENRPLVPTDKAVIYYTRPIDMIFQDDRNILIENMIRLNNIVYR